jgi:glycosyltransferase involved in cell wall biosynthesis
MPGQKQFIEQHPGIGFSYIHDDAKDLASKIELLYNERTILESCKEKAVQLAEQEYNWEQEKKCWLHLVEQLLNDQTNLKVGNQNAIIAEKLYQ